MEFSEEKVHLTAHWVGDCFTPQKDNREELFEVEKDVLTILFVGRLSEEKGINDIIEIGQNLDENQTKYKLIFIGEGPAYLKIKDALPNAKIIDWQSKEVLASMYSSADILLLPSKFDTFSCVVLEALSCGLPVIAYNSKGPKDIIVHGECGYLATGKKEMYQYLLEYSSNLEIKSSFKKNAVLRSKEYNKKIIMQKLLTDLNL
jgi:glycosyltransferase involved in cell wall biosynthesis